ncbi:hypothetical protein UFOVP698_42 [uncultured Caudovirales phage]|uniref:Uncharacterized protein n=1 Tax=uncultured Caudovirales phage TaxID=2100421 RepID=A0A6J5NMI0_9CAUD|nr:hypothetical protein UFOVP698_42 [uncultured Caudovirales phage]
MPALTWIKDGNRLKATHKTKSRTFMFTILMTYGGRYRLDVLTVETNKQFAFSADTVEDLFKAGEQFAAKRPKL